MAPKKGNVSLGILPQSLVPLATHGQARDAPSHPATLTGLGSTSASLWPGPPQVSPSSPGRPWGSPGRLVRRVGNWILASAAHGSWIGTSQIRLFPLLRGTAENISPPKWAPKLRPHGHFRDVVEGFSNLKLPDWDQVAWALGRRVTILPVPGLPAGRPKSGQVLQSVSPAVVFCGRYPATAKFWFETPYWCSSWLYPGLYCTSSREKDYFVLLLGSLPEVLLALQVG